MKLDVIRTQFGKDATNGLLFIDGVFECYTLEDEVREVKVMHETCIPEGEYEIKLRAEGGFHSRYLKRYGADWHKGMLWLQDVPNFTWILIHTLNDSTQTSGCLGVGSAQQDLDLDSKGKISQSRDAYQRMYPKVRDALLNGEKVTIEYSNINLGAKEISNKAQPDMIAPDTIQEKLSEINGNLITLNAKLEDKNII
jgi:hypothetical protein